MEKQRSTSSHSLTTTAAWDARFTSLNLNFLRNKIGITTLEIMSEKFLPYSRYKQQVSNVQIKWMNTNISKNQKQFNISYQVLTKLFDIYMQVCIYLYTYTCILSQITSPNIKFHISLYNLTSLKFGVFLNKNILSLSASLLQYHRSESCG